MDIYVVSKKISLRGIQDDYPFAKILDVTSTSDSKELRYLSPFYPHGKIPVPFTEGMTASCVEAVWQGLKVFEHADVDVTVFQNTSMKGLKRTQRQYGKILGHRKGVYGTELLNYLDARKSIYVPTYYWMLENVPVVFSTLQKLIYVHRHRDIVLLDYNINSDIDDISSPLSHASLIKIYIETYCF